MQKHAWLAWAVLLLAAGAAPPAVARRPVEHVVIIVVDGLRPEAIEGAGARHIQALGARGARATARVVEMPETLPSLVTLVTGVPPSLHHVTWNDDQGREPDRATIFTRAAEEGLRTGLYFGKSKLAILAPRGSADVSFGPGRGGVHRERAPVDAVAAQFAADFARERYGLAFVHLREPDGAGHAHGWMSEPYFAAVRAADAAVGTVLRAIESSGRGGATAILLTADHGGEGDSHHARGTDASWLVPLICDVPGRKPRRIDGAVTLADVAPTVLALLKLPALPDARGTAIRECL
jgi:arylsulfatase A-like enzyme